MIRGLRALAAPYVALFVLSGACALTYEVVWSRLLVHVFGVTAFAVSTVLVSFMGGMALGAMLLGRAADRAKRPLRMFALLEAGIGAYALLLPLLLRGVDFLYGAILPSVPDSVLVRSLVRFAFCLLLLLVPTILMGGTLPALGRGLLRHGDRVGLGVGILYFVNTLGAAAGCALAGFWLIPYLGLSGTVALAVAGNALVAITAWLLDRGSSSPAEPAPEVSGPGPGPAPSGSWPLVVAFGSGLTGLAFEVVWFRVMVQVFGSTVYSFSAMLSVFLLGLALGSILLGPLADGARRPLRLLVATQGCVALFSILGSLSVNHLPDLFLRVLASMGLDFEGMNRTKILLSFLTLLLPAAAFGGTFPICVRLARGIGGTGSRIGRVYAWNTLGAILGSFGAGFLLLPTIGAERTLDLVILVALLLAFATLLAEPGPLDLRFAAPAGLAIVVVTAVLLVKPPWDRTLLGAGVYFEPGHYYDAAGRVRIEPVVADYRLTTYTEGYNDTILSFRSPKGKFITVNGSTTASDQFDDMFTQRMLGHLPMAFHPGKVGSVCIVGLGAGVTAGATALYGAENVTVVELEEGVFAASRFFAKENHGILDAPSAEIRIDDGRNFLKLTTSRFDVISSAPNFPSLTGSGALYSKDYFELCRRRLAPGGIMCQFAPTWRILPEDLKTIVGSFTDVFPHVRVYSSGISLVMLGREEPFPPVDVAEITRRVEQPEVAASLREIGMRGPIEMLSLYAFDEEEAKRFADGAPRNTDDRPRIEFFAPRALFSETIAANLEALREQHVPAEERARRLGLSGAKRDDFYACSAAQDAIIDGQIAVAHGKAADGMQLLIAAASAGYRYAAHLVATTAETAGVRLQNQGSVEEARQQFLAALRFEPERLESLVGAGYLDLFSNRMDEADALLSRAVELYPEAAGAVYRLGLVREVQGRLGDAEALYRRAIALKPILAEPYGLLGRLLLRTGRAAESLPVLDHAVELGENTEGPRLARGEALLALGRTKDALREARAAALRFPTSPEAFDLLARSAGAAGEAGESEMAAKRRDVLAGAGRK